MKRSGQHCSIVAPDEFTSDQELFVAKVGLAQTRLDEWLSLVPLYKGLGGEDGNCEIGGQTRTVSL